MNTLIVVPIKSSMSKDIYAKMINGINQNIKNSNASLFIDQREAPDMPKKTPWTKVSWIRNQILDDGLWKQYTHLLWIDADVVEMPDNLVDSLLKVDAEGIVAPFVGIEGKNTFYDWAAFILPGRDHFEPENRSWIASRNINPKPNYFEGYANRETSLWDCVGTVTLVNTDIYRAGARYEDHPSMTDHYPICKKCRDMGRKVSMANNIKVMHADLPKYGEKWH